MWHAQGYNGKPPFAGQYSSGLDMLQLHLPHLQQQHARQPTIDPAAGHIFGSKDGLPLGKARRSSQQQQKQELQHWQHLQEAFPPGAQANGNRGNNGGLRLQSPEGLLAHAQQVRTVGG